MEQGDLVVVDHRPLPSKTSPGQRIEHALAALQTDSTKLMPAGSVSLCSLTPHRDCANVAL